MRFNTCPWCENNKTEKSLLCIKCIALAKMILSAHPKKKEIEKLLNTSIQQREFLLHKSQQNKKKKTKEAHHNYYRTHSNYRKRLAENSKRWRKNNKERSNTCERLRRYSKNHTLWAKVMVKEYLKLHPEKLIEHTKKVKLSKNDPDYKLKRKLYNKIWYKTHPSCRKKNAESSKKWIAANYERHTRNVRKYRINKRLLCSTQNCNNMMDRTSVMCKECFYLSTKLVGSPRTDFTLQDATKALSNLDQSTKERMKWLTLAQRKTKQLLEATR